MTSGLSFNMFCLICYILPMGFVIDVFMSASSKRLSMLKGRTVVKPCLLNEGIFVFLRLDFLKLEKQRFCSSTDCGGVVLIESSNDDMVPESLLVISVDFEFVVHVSSVLTIFCSSGDSRSPKPNLEHNLALIGLGSSKKLEIFCGASGVGGHCMVLIVALGDCREFMCFSQNSLKL